MIQAITHPYPLTEWDLSQLNFLNLRSFSSLVAVRFKSFGKLSKEYNYRTDISLKINDIVVVPVGDFFSIAVVSNFPEESEVENLKWVVEKVDIESFLEKEKKRKGKYEKN